MAALVLLANAFDLATTYLASPDLAAEWNLLTRRFGLGWGGLFVAKAVGVSLAVAGYAYYLRFRSRCYPAPGLGFREFAHYLSLGSERTHGVSPSLLRHIGVNLGYFWAGMQALIIWVALDNILLVSGFSWGMRRSSEMGYHMLQSVVVGSAVMARFYWTNYRRYRGTVRVRSFR